MNSFKAHLLRFWNFWPPFLFTGIKIVEVSKDWRYVKARLKLRWWNENYVGTQYGGAIFSLTDPFYMVMLMRNLGHDYTIWDKSARIHYVKPGRSNLYAEFRISDTDLEHIRTIVAENNKIDWVRTIEVKDENGDVVATVEKDIYIRRKIHK